MDSNASSLGVLIIAVGALVGPAAAQTQLWISQFGTDKEDQAFALAPDAAGGAFVAGRTYGSLGGPYGGGVDPDAWLARYDGAGAQVWIRQFGGSQWDDATGLAPDGVGGAFVLGNSWGPLGLYLARYNSAGNRLWTSQFGSGASDTPGALAPDGAGGAFAAGYTNGSLGGPFVGARDAWLARYDSAGNRVWIRQFGTSALEWANAVASDGVGGAFIAGFTQGSLGGPSAGDRDRWLARYDSAGNQVWVRQFGTSTSDSAWALAPDGAGGAFVAGYLGFFGDTDAWLARYDSAGNQLWIHQFGTSLNDNALSLAADDVGGAFVTGITMGSLGGPTAGGQDAWLARYDSAGGQVWIRQFGTDTHDSAGALAFDGEGGVFMAGGTFGSLGGPSAGGGWDAWVARYGPDVCYPDCDASGTLNVNDYICFQTKFALGDPYADCDGSGARNVNDYICFQTKFALGCS